MNLKEWRESKGFSLLEVAVMLDRKSSATVCNWEKIGVKRSRIQTDLKRISLGLITDFGGSDDRQDHGD